MKFLDEQLDPAGFSGVMANRLALLLSGRSYVLAGARKPRPGSAAGPTVMTEGQARGAHVPPWLEEFMKRDRNEEDEPHARMRRAATAAWVLAPVANRRG